MRTSLIPLFSLLAVILISGCGEPRPQLSGPTDLASSALIPLPSSISSDSGAYFLDAETTIFLTPGDSALRPVAGHLVELIGNHTTFTPEIRMSDDQESNGIHFQLDEQMNVAADGYTIDISDEKVTIAAKQRAGFFYAIQTIKQIIGKEEAYVYLPTGNISDSPEYEYRGVMLDVARHFFTVEEVKRTIDYLAFYKMNYLHLHLSDDQGWRIEIKSWPKLTEIGGSTEVGGGPGGFYTQEEFKDIVAYGEANYVTIVPEIDMPGHTNSALASYPELNCDGKATELYTGTRVGFSTLCTDKEITYEFLDDVIGEIAAMTPGPYFHIGGDESHVTPMEDYIPFIERAQEIVQKHNKISIGWDEIANAKLLEGNIVQWWASAENAGKALAQGAKILVSPANKAYLDMQYDSTSQFGLHWAAYIPVDSGYIWSPDQLIPEITRENILGIEAPLWSETISDLNEAEYLMFPRLPGYSEIGWTPAEKRDWESYKPRLIEHGKILEDMGVNFYRSKRIEWEEPEMM